jgi:hypothetical protein
MVKLHILGYFVGLTGRGIHIRKKIVYKSSKCIQRQKLIIYEFGLANMQETVVVYTGCLVGYFGM